jgi:hypothetical protein
MKDVPIAGDAPFIDAVADNEEVKKSEHAEENEVGKHYSFSLFVQRPDPGRKEEGRRTPGKTYLGF